MFVRIADEHLGPTATSGPVTPRRVGGGRLGIDIGGKPVFVGLDSAAAESGDAWAGYWPASASAAWPAAAGHLRLAPG